MKYELGRDPTPEEIADRLGEINSLFGDSNEQKDVDPELVEEVEKDLKELYGR